MRYGVIYFLTMMGKEPEPSSWEQYATSEQARQAVREWEQYVELGAFTQAVAVEFLDGPPQAKSADE